MSVENQAVVLLDDQVSVTFNGTSPGGNPVSIPGQPVKVATAGQSSAWADYAAAERSDYSYYTSLDESNPP